MSDSNERQRQRRHFGDDQKAPIVRRHLADKVPVGDLAEEYQVQSSLIYLWIKQLLEQAEQAFRAARGGRGQAGRDPKDRRIAELEARLARQEAKLVQKNGVISELMEENVREKKATGEL